MKKNSRKRYMKELKNQISDVEKKFHADLKKCSTAQQLEEVRITFLGRQGHLIILMGNLKKLSVDEKRVFGPLLNKLKQSLQEAYTTKEQELKSAGSQTAILKEKNFDVTAYKKPLAKGTLHVYTQLVEQLEDIFISMGYQIADGPEIETDYYNFEALNIPADHPARDMHDTFWIDMPNLLMRTHTSTVQIHAMENSSPPLAVIAPGRAYRNEAVDASHDFVFGQIEGLLIDKDISMANLLATAQTFLQAIFNKKNLDIRVRPGYFPFVEPGVEIDAQCPFCKKGCSTCKQTTWIELMGAGLVHPNVLRYGGIDTNNYSGFAFGLGLSRLAMLKYGINDIRLFHSNKLSFLNQF